MRNLYLCISYNVVISLLYVMAAAFLFNLVNMERADYLKMGEVYLPLSGVFLFVYIGGLEEQKGIWEMVCSKKFKFILIHILRIMLLFCIHFFMLFLFMTFIWWKSAYIAFFDSFLGIFIDSAFLGILGMFIADIFREYIIGYIVSIGYYVLATSCFDKIAQGWFQLEGYSNNNITSKYVLACFSAVLLLLDVFYYCKRQRII